VNLHALLTKRTREKGPLRVGLIGAGKFGSMYLAQAKSTAGIHLAAIAAGEMVRWDDVIYDGQDETVKFRREMEALLKKEIHPVLA
jgi:predicted homoserine dehydrogenase-like protein